MNEEIFAFIGTLKHIKKQSTAIDMLSRRFRITKDQAQEFIWAYLLEEK